MAVYKSRRKDAAAQFVADARELRKATVRIARKFPASYKYVTTGPLLQLASEVYMNALKGNSIYVHKDMSERDYELRHRYLAAATASADALLGEITFCYELVDDGNNFFRNKEEYAATSNRCGRRRRCGRSCDPQTARQAERCTGGILHWRQHD